MTADHTIHNYNFIIDNFHYLSWISNQNLKLYIFYGNIFSVHMSSTFQILISSSKPLWKRL